MEYRIVETRRSADKTEQTKIIEFSEIRRRLNDFLLNRARRLTFSWEWTETTSLKQQRDRQFHLVLLKERMPKYSKYVVFLLNEERQSVGFLVWDFGRFLRINSGQDRKGFRRENFMGESLPDYLVHKNFDRIMTFLKRLEEVFPDVRSLDSERPSMLLPGNQLARRVSYRQLKEEAFGGGEEEVISVRLAVREEELPEELKERRRRLRAVVEAMREQTGRDCLTLSLSKEQAPELFDSKFGGLPYWDVTKPYPTDRAGSRLMLLAQMNFDRAGEKDVPEPLPRQGMLQFFIRPDEVYGASFDAPAVQDGFRVIYHEQVDYTVTEEQVRALSIPVTTEGEGSENTPVLGCYALKMSRGRSCLWDGDKRFGELFRRAAAEQGLKLPEGESLYRSLEKEEYQYVLDELNPTGHHMLGYPCFTQYDPRDERTVYDTLLLQIDTEMDGVADYILWGDCGVGSFFISREALEKRRFDDVLYSWDCC